MPFGVKFGEAIKFFKRQVYDDWVDRLHNYYSVAILIFFTAAVTAKQFIGVPIQCWVPQEFNRAWEDYAETYCFVTGTYFVSFGADVPTNRAERQARMTSYYQWIPAILLAQAVLFYMPNVIWNWIADLSRLNVKSIMKMASQVGGVFEIDKRRQHLEILARTISYSLRIRTAIGGSTGCLSSICSFFGIGRWRDAGNYVCCAYILLKVLNCVNVIAQFVYLDYFLGGNEWLWGGRLIHTYLRGEEWTQTGRFARVSFCDFTIRDSFAPGKANYKNYTMECVLLINMWNEKIFFILWCWIIVVAVCSCWNLLDWLCTCFRASAKRNLINRYLSVGLPYDFNSGGPQVIEKFVRDALKSDGVLLLRFISGHAGDMVATEVTALIYQEFVQSFDHPIKPKRPAKKKTTKDYEINEYPIHRARAPIASASSSISERFENAIPISA